MIGSNLNFDSTIIISDRMSVVLLSVSMAVALVLSTAQVAYGRTLQLDWTPEGVRSYRNYSTPLRLNLGDTLELTCRNISNLFIQADRVQYDKCNASAGSGVFDYNGFCFSGSSIRLTLRENSQDLDNTVNFGNNQIYFLTSYSEGSFRANDNTFTSGGQCEDGLKMIFVIGQATVPTVDGGDDNSGGNQDGSTGPPPPDNEGLNTKSSGTTGVNLYIIIGAAAGGVFLVASVCIVIMIIILCAKKATGYCSTPFHTSTKVTLTQILFKGTDTSDGAPPADDQGNPLYDEARVNYASSKTDTKDIKMMPNIVYGKHTCTCK